MTLDSEYLHKILKDKTRCKIVLLLHDRNKVTYAELMEALKTRDRGRLNYHLKAMSPLLEKTDNSYCLSEQGVLAWKMLQEFAYAQKARLATIIKYGRNSIALGLVVVFFISYNQYLSIIGLFGVATALSIITLALVVLVKVQYGRLSSCRTPDCIDVSLQETLTDPTRRKIVSLLRENGSLSYTELMNRAGISSNGQMNYHLKMLSDVLSVDERGQYSLNEKGVFAYTSQHSLPTSRSLLNKNPLWQQWTGITFVSIIIVLASVFFYTRGTLDLETSALNVVNVALVSSSLFYLAKVNDELKLYKVKNTRVP